MTTMTALYNTTHNEYQNYTTNTLLLNNGEYATEKTHHDPQRYQAEKLFHQKLHNKYDNIFTPTILETQDNVLTLITKYPQEQPTSINTTNLEQSFFTWYALQHINIEHSDKNVLIPLIEIIEDKVHNLPRSIQEKFSASSIMNRTIKLNNNSHHRLTHGNMTVANVRETYLINPVGAYGDNFYDLATWLAYSLDNSTHPTQEHIENLIYTLSRIYVQHDFNNDILSNEYDVYHRLYEWLKLTTIINLSTTPNYSTLSTALI